MSIEAEDKNLKATDYISIVANSLTDVASAFSVAGPFIAAVKNVAINVAAAKQRNRLVNMLTHFAERVERVEELFDKKSQDDNFLILFYRLLYFGRDELDAWKQEAYVNLGKKLLETDLPFNETQQAIETLAGMTSYEIKLLDRLKVFKPQWKKTEEVSKDENIQRAVGTTEPDVIKDLIVQLWKKGLVKESHHGAILGPISSDSIDAFIISRQGEILLHLISTT
jgi:hypothetical protein